MSRPALTFVPVGIHGPEGCAHPAGTAMMSKAVPENAQGQLHGGLLAITYGALTAGTDVRSQILGWSMRERAAWRRPDAGYVFAAGVRGQALLACVSLTRREDH